MPCGQFHRCKLSSGTRQSRIVPSRLAERTWFPSGLTATPHTGKVWPAKQWRSRPVSTSQSRKVRSSPQEMIRASPGRNTAFKTGAEWPSNRPTSFPVPASRRRMCGPRRREGGGHPRNRPRCGRPRDVQARISPAPRRHVPDLDHAISAAGDDPMSIGREVRIPGFRQENGAPEYFPGLTEAT